MVLFEMLAAHNYGELHFGRDEASGLACIIAIHDTRLGPALGGCRMRRYDREEDALFDVVRLARGMTYKGAMAGLKVGGGKSVILAPPAVADRAKLFHAFGRFVDSLGGRYTTAEDSGTSINDMVLIREKTKHVTGLPTAMGGSGDPSPFTALGVRRGMEAAVEVILGRPSLRGLTVAVQGVGHVGMNLAREVRDAGARLAVADIDPIRAEIARKELGAEVVPLDRVLEMECDVLAPCALGAVFTHDNIKKLKCKVIAGAANNQLYDPSVGRALFELGIAYAPDYVINAGGLINVVSERDGYDAARCRTKTLAIHDTVATLFERSKRDHLSPEVVADRMADEILAAAG